MNREITDKTKLSIGQQNTLVEIISDQFGPDLTFDEFTDQVLLLCKRNINHSLPA